MKKDWIVRNDASKKNKAREFTADNYNFFMTGEQHNLTVKKWIPQQYEKKGRERFAVNQVKRLKILDSCSMA